MHITRRRRRRNSFDSNVDMTPMLDIVFIMLIFFIVTAVFIDERGLDLAQSPDVIDPPSPPSQAISVFVYENGTASVNGRLTDVPNVPARVQLIRAENPKASVLISAEQTASLESIVFLKDQFIIANIPASLKIKAQ